jgi:hypothetical protein
LGVVEPFFGGEDLSVGEDVSAFFVAVVSLGCSSCFWPARACPIKPMANATVKTTTSDFITVALVFEHPFSLGTVRFLLQPGKPNLALRSRQFLIY